MKKLAILFLLLATTLSNYKETTISKEEIKGVFISYIELQEYIKRESEEESKQNINKMLKNVKDLNINTIILQVRSNCDAIYDSKYFHIVST